VSRGLRALVKNSKKSAIIPMDVDGVCITVITRFAPGVSGSGAEVGSFESFNFSGITRSNPGSDSGELSGVVEVKLAVVLWIVGEDPLQGRCSLSVTLTLSSVKNSKGESNDSSGSIRFP